MEIFWFFFIIGMIVGSFYNVVAIRTLKGEKLSFPPSHCVNCNHKLSALDLVPVFSWLFLRGKCRYCKQKISAIYPFGELLTGFSYGLIMYQFGFTLEALIHIVFITVLILATAADLKSMTVPDRFVIVGLVLVLGLRIYYAEDLWFYIISALIAFGLLVFIFFISKGSMGGADIKLYALIGLSIGWIDSVGSLFYASMVATLFYLVVHFMNKTKFKMKREIPFVPFITIGVLCTYFLPFFKFENFM